jgi:antitoxin (DNA-binding transcriptional repressor) of toxin-antitoxin stability system
MNTITATELRTNLDDVMRRVGQGQELLLTHRFYGSIKLSPSTKVSTRGRLHGLSVLRASQSKQGNHPAQDLKTADLKQLYHEHLEAKYNK